MSRLRAGWCGVRIPTRIRKFLSFPKCSDRLWGQLSFRFSGYRVSLLRVNRPVREVNHSLPRLWMGRAVPLLPLYAFVAITRTTLLYRRNIKHVTASVLSSRLWAHKSLRPSRLSLSHCIYFRISPHSTSLLVSLLPLTVYPLFSNSSLSYVHSCLLPLLAVSILPLSGFLHRPTSLFWLRITGQYLYFYLLNLRSVLCIVVMEDRAMTRLWIYGKQREDVWDGNGRYESSYKILVWETEEKKPAVKI